MKTDNPRVAAVVVNWNQRDLLLETLDSLYASDYPSLQVIVVDNGSKDGSVEAVTTRFPEAIVIRNDSNLGFARGSNQGFERAAADQVEYVMFINSDATVEKSTISTLAGLLESKPDAGAAAPYIFYYDQRDVIWFGGGIVRLWRGWIGHRYLRKRFKPQRHQPRETDYLTGCVLLARTGVLQQLGGFDTYYTLYAEDVDLSLRMRLTGWRLWVTPDAKAFHRISATAGGEMSPFKAFHRGRSTAQLFRRYVKPWEWVTLVISGAIGVGLITLKLIITGRLKTAFALWRGIINGLFNLRLPANYSLGETSEPE